MLKKLTVFVSVLFLIGNICWVIYLEEKDIYGAVLSENEYQLLIDKRDRLETDERVKLYIEGIEAPYVKSEECYYIPLNISQNSCVGRISSSIDGKPALLAWKADEAFKDLEGSIRSGHLFQGIVYSEKEWTSIKILFTGMPVMSVSGTMGEENTAEIAVFDPVFSETETISVKTGKIYYEIRGNMSRSFDKKCYKINFLNENGSGKYDISLLGMRKDDDWHLKAMYTDKSKLRDKLSMDMWNEIADLSDTKADTGCRMEYLELIINGEYRGLYGLVEPTDYKSLGLDKTNDIIYKVSDSTKPTEVRFKRSEIEKSFECAGVKIRDAGKTYYDGIWDPFKVVWNKGYEMRTIEDLSELYNCIDRQNFIDYQLYYNIIGGVDNRYKNIIYSTAFDENGEYVIRRIPWDEDYSWGNDLTESNRSWYAGTEYGSDFWNNASEEYTDDPKNTYYNPRISTSWLNEDLFCNMQQFDSDLNRDLAQTWELWRSLFVKESLWKEYANEQMSYLVDSGAFARDTKRWPDSENDESTEEIEEYIDQRFGWLDTYILQLEGN